LLLYIEFLSLCNKKYFEGLGKSKLLQYIEFLKYIVLHNIG